MPELGSGLYYVLSCSDGGFYGLSNVSNVDVFYYRASESSGNMDSDILDEFSDLKYLEIDGGVRTLAFVPPIPSLKILSLIYTSITYLSNNALSNISRILMSLSLTFSEIEVISEEAFAGLTDLLHLDLSHNRMEKVYTSRHLTNLQSLDLSFNFIRSVSSSDFSGFHSLLQLNLDGNIISSLSYLEFPSSGFALSIKANPLQNISWLGKSIRRLQSLELSGTLLLAVSKNTFTNTYFDSLKITNCGKLRLVEAQAFINITVTNLTISNNPSLEFIDSAAFKDIHSIKHLDLSSNRLHLIPEELSLLPLLKHISVLNNSLYCDCNMNWMFTPKVKIIIESANSSALCAAGDETRRAQSICLPSVVFRSPNATVIDEGSSALLRCKVGGVPPPEVVWLYGNYPIPSGTTIKTVNGDLEISQTRPSYAGVYKCVATNAEGIVSETFYLGVKKDNARIIILKTGKDYVEVSWRTSNPLKRYKAILIDTRNNNQTSYAIKQFTRSRHSQSGYIISGLKSGTTYRVCLAYEDQEWADSEKCETFTTSESSSVTPRGITDYSLYGIIIATIISILFICIIVCVCITSRNYASRRQKQLREGVVSESSYGLMTSSFSQRSGISALYDNPGTSFTPVSHMSRSGSYYKYRRAGGSSAHTPTTPTVCFVPELQINGEPEMVRILKRTMSDPQLLSSPTEIC
ncbi:leucine-rich repeat neuronal protein 1-like [Watersipora subatra]|uniref:leucine-rich repeat neuronal protein 1-like n=1 Tax=Watersipora subatra TaxID=2589382 RepID=UPI00355C928F